MFPFKRWKQVGMIALLLLQRSDESLALHEACSKADSVSIFSHLKHNMCTSFSWRVALHNSNLAQGGVKIEIHIRWLKWYLAHWFHTVRFTCARGTPALRPLNSQQHATTHVLALYCIKCKRAALSTVLCSATHALCVLTVTVDAALSSRDKWTPHGEQDPVGPLEDHFRSCCFSVLNGSLGPGKDFMLLPKLPGEHPGSSLGEKRLH